MVPYFILIGAPAFIYILLGVSHIDTKLRTKITVDAFFGIMLVLLMLRAESIGIDLPVYKYHFENYSKLSFTQIKEGILSGTFETGYVTICRIVGIFTDNFRYVLIACALIAVIPVWHFYRREEKFGFFLSVMFANVAPFTMYFSGLRQAMAMAFAILAYYCCKEKKPVRFLITVLVAFLFHRSALILLLMYPVFHLRLKSPAQLLFAAPPIALVFVFKVQIFTFLMQFSGDTYYSRYAEGVKETGASSVLILLFALTAVSFVIPDQNLLEEDDIGLRNILLLAAVLQIFAGVHSIAMRMNYYFLLFVPIAVGRCLGKSATNRKVADIALICLTCFMSLYFFYHAYNSEDILQVFPYVSVFAE